MSSGVLPISVPRLSSSRGRSIWRSTISRVAAKQKAYSMAPAIASPRVSRVSHACSAWPSKPATVGPTTMVRKLAVHTAMNVREAPRRARSRGSCVITVASEP